MGVTIHIKHLGPIKDTGSISITPVTLLIGKQSSGKSTLLKVLCYCTWVEKHIMIDGETLLRNYTHYNRFIKELKSFHHFDDSFFNRNTEFHYKGSCINIDFDPGAKNVRISKHAGFNQTRHNEKISFIPSERNVVSAVQNIEKNYKSSDFDVLFNYLLEYSEAKATFTEKSPIALPFDHKMAYFYDRKENKDKVSLEPGGVSIEPSFTSSGVQSALPLVIIAKYVMSQAGHNSKTSINDITNAISKVLLSSRNKDISLENLTAEDLKKVSQLLRYHCSKLFIEEMELNLFPESQFDVVRFLLHLLDDANKSCGNNDSFIVLTTHSPYVLTSLNLFMKAAVAMTKSNDAQKIALKEAPLLNIDAFSAYQITGNGNVEDIVDHDYQFIKGDYLDSLSDKLNEKEALLDGIIYGETD